MTAKTIPDDTLRGPVEGMNIAPGTFAEQLDAEQPTLIVFLRHYG
ncbi:MAG: hypothetical protein U0822_01630 [Anaerolineae bacterium]